MVRINPEYEYDYAEDQTAYLNPKTGRFYPSTEVWYGDQLVFKSNALGGKGRELEPSLPVIGFFGDSVVQCVSPMDSWVHRVQIPDYEVFNGGVEGSSLQATTSRVLDMHARNPFAAVVLHPGWHDIFYGNTDDAHWRSEFDRLEGLPRVIHMTLDGDFHPGLVDRPLDCFTPTEDFDPQHRGVYAKWAGIDYTPTGMQAARDRLEQKNALIRDYARTHGRGVIELSELCPKSYADLGLNYFDFIHFRMERYPEVAAAVSRQLAQLIPVLNGGDAAGPHAAELQAAKPLPPAQAPQAAAPTPTAKPVQGGLGKGKPAAGAVYPLW